MYNQISETVDEQAGFGRVIFVAFLKAILHIPALISFPLAASLLKGGDQLLLLPLSKQH